MHSQSAHQILRSLFDVGKVMGNKYEMHYDESAFTTKLQQFHK
jgi:hypothetical protein